MLQHGTTDPVATDYQLQMEPVLAEVVEHGEVQVMGLPQEAMAAFQQTYQTLLDSF